MTSRPRSRCLSGTGHSFHGSDSRSRQTKENASLTYWYIEPVSGFEPLTCRLQEACSRALCPLPAPMPHESATAAPITRGFPDGPFHDPFHAAPRRERLWKLAGCKPSLECHTWTYRVIVSEYTLPEVPRPRRRYEVTVALPRPPGVEALLPPGSQAAVDIAAAAIAAEGLLTAWTCRQSVVSMIVDLPSMADALTAGAQMARVLGSGDGLASVTVQPIATVH